MSFLRRAAAASVIAVALATCGAAPSALAAPSTSSASATVPSDGEPGARPIQMGPFMFPSTGQLQGGFGWNTSGGGY